MAALVSIIVPLILAYTVAGQQLVTVQTAQGALRGLSTATINGTAMYSFSGVPFAAPPVGDLRFQAPQPHPAWEGERDALEEGSECLQGGFGGPGQLSGDEDCLYLNVYTPSLSEDAGLAVMVYFFGGAFIVGSASAQNFGPDFLVDDGVILVTTNYRLGVMGMLSVGDQAAPGNNAFKDQAAALRWVQENIRAFGGDPAKVTIFGQSAGGTSVELHMYSALSRGLFWAAISQSGSAIGGGQGQDRNRETAFCIGAELGLQTDDSAQLVAFLQQATIDDLYGTSCGTAFGMTVEEDVEGAFLTADHSRLGAWAEAGNYTHVPLISGVTSAEYNMMLRGGVIDDETVEELNNDFEAAIDSVLRLGDEESKQQAAAAIRPFYFGDASAITAQDAVQFSAMMTDLNNGEPADTTVHLMSAAMTEPVFYYEYDFTGRNLDTGLPGASHESDLDSLFNRPGSGQNLDPESDEMKVRSTMVRLWTNFAKYRNPSPADDPVIPGGWQPFEATNLYYLSIDVNTTLSQHRNAERMDFLHTIIPPYY